MYACNYLENGFLNILRGTAFTAPARCWLALYLNDPGETGTAGTEVSYPGYARKDISFSAPASMNSGIGIQNLSEITFATPADAVGTITHIGILDSQTGGNMLVRGELSEPLMISANQPPVFLVGDVMFYLTGGISNAYKTRLLNILRGQSISGVTPCHSLWNGSPEAGGAELSGDNYARCRLTFAAPAEQTSGQLLIQNSLAASYNRPSTEWGVWNWSAIYSAATGGEPIFIRQLPEEIPIKRGYMPTFAAGAVKLGLN